MKTIFVVDNPALEPLFANGTTLENYKVKCFDERRCVAEIDKSSFDYALVSPLVYALINKRTDYRIVRSKILAIEDYSGLFTICIAKNKRTLNTICYEIANEFIIAATRLLLSERFGIELEVVDVVDDADVILTNDATNYDDYITIDLTEDWYDTFEVPLILGFWIVKAENFADNSVNEISTFALPNLPTKESINSTASNDNDYDRFGCKYWQWDDRFEDALDKIFDMLFYKNYVEHIADVKFAGINYEDGE
ncbi:MAG: hypothetical protein LBO69_07130 [Ignavibacteria bacterium]|jgi:hypothetical protein|nr:hypothetical protein [Ignavibacteria bacterium]